MKAPNLSTLDGKTANDAFTQTAEAITQQAKKTSPKTYSLPKRHTDYIASLAMKLGQTKGKVVSASEALRMIVEYHAESIQS